MPDDVTASRMSPVLARVKPHVGLIVALTVAGLLLGVLVGTLQPKTYTAASRVFLSSQASFDALGGSYTSDPSRYLDQQASVMTSQPLLARAIELGAPADGVEELQQSVDVVASAKSDVLTVRATAAAPEQASQRVDSVIEAFRDYQADRVQDQLTAVESVSNSAERRLARQRAAVFGDGIQLVEDASVETSTSVVRNASVLALAGLLLGLAIAFTRDARKARSRAARRQKRALEVAAGWHLPDDDYEPARATGSEAARRSSAPASFTRSRPGNLPGPESVTSPENARSADLPSGST